jgi:hypothetical protein
VYCAPIEVIAMKLHHRPEPPALAGPQTPTASESDPGHDFRPINPVRAALLRVWGPAESWDNPLTGTKYDPTLRAERQHDSLERRRERWERRKQHWNDHVHPPFPQ